MLLSEIRGYFRRGEAGEDLRGQSRSERRAGLLLSDVRQHLPGQRDVEDVEDVELSYSCVLASKKYNGNTEILLKYC